MPLREHRNAGQPLTRLLLQPLLQPGAGAPYQYSAGYTLAHFLRKSGASRQLGYPRDFRRLLELRAGSMSVNDERREGVL